MACHFIAEATDPSWSCTGAAIAQQHVSSTQTHFGHDIGCMAAVVMRFE